MTPTLHSYSRVARLLGVDRRTLPVLVRVLGLTPKPVAWNGKARGLDDDDVRVLKKALGLDRKRA